MYTFFTDKSEIFECKISLQGAKISESKARLVLESDDMNFIFYGKIGSDGKCTIPVSKLKRYISEDTKGKAKLEVIAEDTFFQPWSDSFEVKTSKKVTVEVKGNNEDVLSDNTKKVTISEVKNTKPTKPTPNKLFVISEEFFRLLSKNKITINNLRENKNRLNTIAQQIVSKYKLNESQKKQLINAVITKLSK